MSAFVYVNKATVLDLYAEYLMDLEAKLHSGKKPMLHNKLIFERVMKAIKNSDNDNSIKIAEADFIYILSLINEDFKIELTPQAIDAMEAAYEARGKYHYENVKNIIDEHLNALLNEIRSQNGITTVKTCLEFYDITDAFAVANFKLLGNYIL